MPNNPLTVSQHFSLLPHLVSLPTWPLAFPRLSKCLHLSELSADSRLTRWDQWGQGQWSDSPRRATWWLSWACFNILLCYQCSISLSQRVCHSLCIKLRRKLEMMAEKITRGLSDAIKAHLHILILPILLYFLCSLWLRFVGWELMHVCVRMCVFFMPHSVALT